MNLRRSLPAWLAILAMALHGLWPLLAQAAPREATVLVPTCTVAGVTHYVELPLGRTPLEKKSATHHEHCKLCVFSAGNLALPPAADVPLLEVEPAPAERICRATVHSPHDLSYPPGNPRAPPHHS